MDDDRIEKETVLRAPLERVWAAVTDSGQFAMWFGAELDGAFELGAELTATMVGTKVDPEVAQMQAPFAGTRFRCRVERMEPMSCFEFSSWQWPVTADNDPPRRTRFELEAVEGGTRLRITESGFSSVPAERRDAAREGNAAGWELQLRLIATFLGQAV